MHFCLFTMLKQRSMSFHEVFGLNKDHVQDKYNKKTTIEKKRLQIICQ